MDFPVYIDTSLGHNFVMLVSDSDTVHDVKGKILLEYANCFPEMGEINAHAIKIDHRGTLYRLSESVLVGKVFEATIGARLLHVDASSTGPKHNEVRRSKDFLINSKECRDRNPTMLRIENNASHLLQCVPDIPCHSNRDGNSSGVIFDQNVHMVSDSPKKKSKRTKSIIGASGVGTSQSECGKGIDVSKVQKGMDYSYDLYKNVRQNAGIKQGNNSSKRKDCGQQSDLQIDGQSDPRKKRHRREDVHTKFDIDKPQVACKEILSKKSEENIFDRTNDPIVKQNNIDLTSLNTPKERKKKKKSSDVSHKQKYNSETTSSHLTLHVANNDRSKHRKKKKKGKHSDNVEVKNILIAADNVEKSLADENGDPVIPMKNKSDTLTISSLETKNALAVSEKVNKEICRQLETPTSEFPLEKEQVISFAEESAMNENSKELVLTSPLDAKAQSNDLETPGFRTIASLPQKISSLPESLGTIDFQEDVDLVIPSEDDVSTAPLANNDRSKRRKKKKKGKHSDNVEVKNILVAADNVEKSLADENGDSDIPIKNKSDTITVSSLETKNALAISEKVNKEICRQLETPTSEFPLEKEQVIPIAEESAMNENSIKLVLTSPLDAKAQSNDLETPGFRTIASLPQKISSLPESLGTIGFQEDVDLVIPSEDDVSTAPLVNNDRSKRRKKKKKGKHSDNVEVKNILVAADNVEKSLADENGDSDIPMKNKSDTITVSSLETKNALAVSEKVNKEICRLLETPTSEFPLEKEQVIPVAEESAMNENSIELVLTSPLDAKAQSNDLETPGFRTIASLPQKISSLPESLGTIGFQEDVDLVIPSEDDVSTAPLVNNDRSKRRKKKKKGKHSDNVEVKNILVAADNVEKSLADENGDSDIPMKNKSDTITVSSLETKNALAVSEKVNKEICRLLETPTSEFPLEKEQVIPVAEESAMNENSIELVLTSPLDAKAQSNDLETPGFRTIASLPQKISSLPESLGTIDFQEDVDLVIPSEDDVSTAPLANNDRSKRRKKKKKGKHSDNVEVKNILVAADNVEKSLADENGDSDIPMKNKSDTITVSSLETKNALAVSEMVNKEICRQLETPTSEFPLKKEQVIPVAEESAMNENSIELVLMSPLDAKAQSNDLETPGFRTIASLPQKISSLPESLGAIGFQEDVDLVIPSEDDVSTASLVNKDKSKHCKKKKGKHSDNVKAKNILVAADNVEKLLADENRDSAIPMKSTKNTLSVSSLETKTALAAAENVIEKICRQIETPTSEFPFEKEKVILGGESVMDENSTELVLTSLSDAKMRPVVGEEVNFAEFFLPDVAVAKKKPTVSPEDSGNRKSEIKNRHIFKSKHRELQEEFTTKEELIGGEDENMQRIAKSKRDVENSNMSMQVTVPHRNVHIPCESTHTSKETNLTGIQTRKRSTKSSDKKVHGGVLLSDLEPRELIDNKSHKVKGKASPVNKKTERTKSNSSRKSNSNLAVHSDDVGKETKDSLSVFDSKTKGRNDCYRIAFRKVSGGLLEILENSKTEKPLPFDSLSIFDHISDNVAKDKDTDNSKRQFDFSSSSSDSDSEISDVNETQTVHLHASQPFKESHGIHKSECISGDKSGNREILRHVTTGSQASGQEMKLGAILRNSRSYKKAKLVASQTPAEETEPESLL